jgi:hypothetical protein
MSGASGLHNIHGGPNRERRLLNSFHAAGFKSNYQDLTEKHRGILSGVGNTFATLASTVGALRRHAIPITPTNI